MSDILAYLARGVQFLLALGGAYLAALWFASIVWTFRDIEARSRSVVTQIAGTLLPLLFPFIGIPVYLILRPKDTLDAAYQRSLEEEYLLQDLEELPLCPACQHFVEEDFVLCPHCHASLRHPCVACERLVDLRWTLCPYCGTAQSEEKTEAPIAVPAARWTAPSKRQRRPVEPAAVVAANPAPLSVVNSSRQRGGGEETVAMSTGQGPRRVAGQNGNGKRVSGRFSPSAEGAPATGETNGKPAPSLITPGASGEIEERKTTKSPITVGSGNGD